MEIKKAQYMYGFALMSQYQALKYPEIAVAGRSNVGKSSLINMLTNHSKLAKVGQTPGKTRMVNVFLLNESFTLMDLPGYGFARVSEQEKQRWAELIEGYFYNSPMLKHVFLLLDVRHEPTQEDLSMIHWLHYYHIPFSVIATKADKLSRAQLNQTLPKLSRATGIIVNEIYPVSSLTRQGKERLLEKMGQVLQAESDQKAVDENGENFCNF